MKIAIIGSGIAGNTLAHHLNKTHEITVFESESHIGGHTHSHEISHEGRIFTVDTGFIVFNDRNYPNFVALLESLNVPSQPSEMSFSVRSETIDLEYNGTTLNSLFAQRSNLLKPNFIKMILNILRFNKNAPELLTEGEEITLGDYLKQGKYSRNFIDHYIIPMGSAIWSTQAQQMLDFPARFFVRFFHHHGMLTINERPKWLTITGGSATYVRAMTEPFKNKIRLNSPVESVRRLSDCVLVQQKYGSEEKFDYVFFTCPSDTALKILVDKSEAEIEILSAFSFQENTVFLHHDASLMPKRKLAWAAWNYHVSHPPANRATVTYNMNILQNLQSQEPLLVTLNHTDKINPDKVIKRLQYRHPVFTLNTVKAQSRHAEICGHNRTGFAGAYWRNGFHEDGVVSALEALKHFSQSQLS